MKKKIIAVAVATGIILNSGLPVFAATQTTAAKNPITYEASGWTGNWGSWGSGNWNSGGWGSGNWNWDNWGSGGQETPAPEEPEVVFALETPSIKTNRFIHQTLYAPDCWSVNWTEVEGAVSYEVECTKGTDYSKTYTTEYTSMSVSANRGDSFVNGCMRGAKVRVRAVDADGNYSDWSESNTVGCNKFH